MIKFLKNHLTYKAGEETEHLYADYLIRLGVAEKVEKKGAKEKKEIAHKKEKYEK